MSLPFVPFDAERDLDWIALTDALARAHELPKAEVADSFLYRGQDTLLNRAAWIDGLGSLVKTATIFPGNAEHGLPAVNGGVTLYSDKTGVAEALLDFHLVTKWKTAGDSLLAARRLARPGSRRILVMGAGTVAASLIEAYGAAFPEARFEIWNRTSEKAVALAERYGASVAEDLPEAVGRADIVTSATMSTTPILHGEWLRPGQHVDLIGAYRPDMREADDAAMARARVFVDSYDTTLEHIGELIEPMKSGAIGRADVVADYYELAAFERVPEDITLFKNGGGAHLDLMTSRYILDAWKG
ncbi:ornithine cyclodeaminase family protein [Aliiruegeria sabulilitoris]|uniref:ornithine cyclodeaminase family protein n=1 Tax=Aliiruegeria sabulilitoris TaxID=1510458 RepID=UPI000831C408|nr:NAD(P)-binding domain-containing protein [Aliiruegeria sabulilitoris]NDR55526.1 ornithine cyclodeaminase [Pseudoruegeria sp. M32A2M]